MTMPTSTLTTSRKTAGVNVMRRTSAIRLLSTVPALLVITACGSGPNERVAVSAETDEAADAPETPGATVGYQGDPGDLFTLTASADSNVLMQYESYEQMRDYSDVVVVATLQDVVVTKPRANDGTLSGEVQADFLVLQQVGGREAAPKDGTLSVVLPLDAEQEVTERVLARMHSLFGTAEYLLFARKAVPRPGGVEDVYVVNRENGPGGVLAVWPGDGRLAVVQGRDDMASEALVRGEERTGTSTPTTAAFKPSFDGPAPIGLRVEELANNFAVPVGSTATEPPAGWEAYLRAVERASAAAND